MKFDKSNWKSIDINIDSLWIIGPRAKGGKRENNYHGNFVPQIPDHLIRRYTEPGEIILLGFYMMDIIKKNIKCKLKGIVVKDIVGNRGKMGSEGLWRYRTLKSDTFLFKHEYIFVFKKG